MMLMIGTVASQVSACTGFTYNDENNVFACHNDDSGDININMRFFPAKDNKYGMVIFEFGFFESDGTVVMIPFAGMNDQGCWFNSYGTPYLVPVNSGDKPFFSDPDCYYKDSTSALAEYFMAKCSIVSEVIDIIDDYNLEEWSFFQLLVADGTGNSAIIEGDDIIYKEGDFQVVSNFLQSHPELGGYPCDRYDTAISMLENMVEPSVEYFRDICDATHVESLFGGTVYTMICDLSSQIMYLYYISDFEKQVVIDLNEELAKGEHYIYLGSLFEPDGNQPPVKPDPPTGNESGAPGEIIEYSIQKTSDPDGDRISYLFDWGDGAESFWLYKSRGSIKYSHNWTEEGTYEIRVKARDQYGVESEWSDPLVISMPKNRDIEIFNPWILRLIHRFPILKILT
jgi:choloylglycine hydrolase